MKIQLKIEMIILRITLICALSSSISHVQADQYPSSGVNYSSWALATSEDGIPNNMTYARTQTEVHEHGLIGELGIACVSGEGGYLTTLVMFNILKSGKPITWQPDTTYNLDFRSSVREQGYFQIGAKTLSSSTSLVNAIVHGEGQGDRKGLDNLIQELTRGDKTLVRARLGSEPIMQLTFSSTNAKAAINKVLSSCKLR